MRQRNDLTQEIIDLEIELRNVGQNDGLKIQAALLRDILELRGREVNAIIRINRAQLEMNEGMTVSRTQIKAGIYENLAAQKTLNQGIIDGVNQTFDTILKKIQEPFDKLNEKTKGYLAFIIEPIKAVQAQGLRKVAKGLVDTVLPDGPLKDAYKEKIDSTGNPVLDEAKKQTDKLKTQITLLEKVAENTGGLPVGYKPQAVNGKDGIAGVVTSILSGASNGNNGQVPPTGTIDEDGTYTVNGNDEGSGGSGGGGIKGIIGGIVNKIFGGGDSNSGIGPIQKTGNAALDENKKQTEYLRQILLKIGKTSGTKGGGLTDILGGLGGGGGDEGGDEGEGREPWGQGAGGGGASSGGTAPSGGEGGGNMFGGIKGMFAPQKNILTGKDSKAAGIMGGIGSIAAMVGPMIGGRARDALSGWRVKVPR